MPSPSYLVLGLLASAITAWADNPPRCAYRPDSCGQQAKACKRECSDFLRATVTPCQVTSTVQKTITVTKTPVTTTLIGTVTTTDSFSTLVTSSSTFLIEDTLTETNTITDTVTTTTTEITTTTEQPISAPLGRRNAESTRPLPVVPTAPSEEIEARGAPAYPATTCKPKTSRPSNVPGSASSACRNNPAQFSSACACAGVSASTTTLRPVTTTITNTKTIAITPAATVTSTATSHVSVTNTQTTVELTTLETIVTTEFVTATTTTTSTETDTSTTTAVIIPTCTAYRFVAQDGPYAGQFVTGGHPDTNSISYGFVSFSTDPTTAGSFTLQSNGRVYDEVNAYGWISQRQDYYYILQMTDRSQSVYGVPYVTCSIQQGGTSITGAVGTLQCGFEGGSQFSLGPCPGTGANLLQFSGESSSTCSPANLAVIPVGLTAC